MKNSDFPPSDANKLSPSSRREFLKNSAGLAAGAATIRLASTDAPAAARRRTRCCQRSDWARMRSRAAHLGRQSDLRFSHFNKLLDEHLKAWHTPERVVNCSSIAKPKGLNTFQNSYRERTLSDLEKFRAAGGKMHWLCLGNPDWDQKPHLIEDTAKRKPIGIARTLLGRPALSREEVRSLDGFAQAYPRHRRAGRPFRSQSGAGRAGGGERLGRGLLHVLPLCRTRSREEYVKLLGADLPLGEIYLPSDPPRMFKVVQQTRKPCLVYKVFAAGRRIGTPSEVRRCLETALSNIKPSDAMIVGMYQEFGDQVGENAAMVRDLCRKG